eukprot:gene12631-16088_t
MARSSAINSRFAAAQGFLTAYTRQLVALQKSKLLLDMLPEKMDKMHEFIPPLFTAAIITVAILALSFYTKVFTFLPNTILIASCFMYIGIFACYIEFRRQFNTLAKNFRSPL